MLSIPIASDNSLNSCFNIRYSNELSTCFLYRRGERIFFVGAQHALYNVHDGDNILLRSQGDLWSSLTVKEIIHNEEGHDVSVFTLHGFTFDPAGFNPNPAGVLMGSPVIYLGFPHGLVGNYPARHGYPTPLSKVAFLSGRIRIKGVPVTVLDGLNNPGFSGGPVYGNDKMGQPTLAGIINGYRFETEAVGRVYKKSYDGTSDEEVPGHFVRANSGMIYSTAIHDAFGIMDQLETTNG